MDRIHEFRASRMAGLSWRRYPARYLLLMMVCAFGAGCSGDRVVEINEADLSTFYWKLALDIHATTVAVGGTQMVVARPRTVAGDTISGLPAPVFTSQDSTKVTVDQSGVITGITETSGTAVIATLTAQGITHADTTIVAVTAESHVLASFEIAYTPGDERIGQGDYRPLTVVALDDHGDPLDGLSVQLQVLTPATLTESAGELAFYATQVGIGRIAVQTTSYGVTMADTMEYQVGYPSTGTVQAQAADPDTTLAFGPHTVVIAVNGTVTWYNFANGPINVTFDNDVENVEGGNIETLEPGDFDPADNTRQFLAAGTYHYTNTMNGQTGQVVVVDNP